MKNIDSIGHVTGRSRYVDDIPLMKGSLHAVVVGSPFAHGEIIDLNIDRAAQSKGIYTILTAKDIPGQNQIGGIIPDEELLAESEVYYVGQPIALILAHDELSAFKARELIQINISEKLPVTKPRIAWKSKNIIGKPRTFQLGDPENVWDSCAHVISGSTFTNGQEHLYIETQGAYAFPEEKNKIKIFSSTQGPTAVQRAIARVLNIGMHEVEVDVQRLGGGFGGKEDQATHWATLAALGVKVTDCPVKLVLHRMDDMTMTGKRHPYEADYKIGIDSSLKIIAYEVVFFQNAGAVADLSPAVLERTLFHATNSYYIPNVKVTAYSCRTNLPPNTAFRGFGGPQGMFVIEAAINHLASEIRVQPHIIQQKNLLSNGDVFPYGQIAQNVELSKLWNSLTNNFHIEVKTRKIDQFNQRNYSFKKGYSLMPVTFGISFTKTQMNQARALIHIYSDATVGISTGAVEMGQGVNTKMVQVASELFSIHSSRIRLESTNTTRVANTSPSAASSTSDLNGKALQNAGAALLTRLKTCASIHLKITPDRLSIVDEYVCIDNKPTDWTWEKLIEVAFMDRVNLSEHGHYSTPEINFDKEKEKGHPFAYHTYGLAMTEVTIDCIRGIYTVDEVSIVHDFGKLMNEPVNFGQIEGGLVQGIGWMTMEEVIYDEKGRLKSNALSTYKIPDIYSAPEKINIIPLESDGVDLAIHKSKAVGEPPLMYGIGTYFALDHAVKAFNPNYKSTYNAPFTPEKVLNALYS